MKFLFVLFLLPLQLFAQDITGVWTGTLYSDSTRYIRYELAISEYNGELSGYSHTIFVVDSIENVGVKSIKVKKEDEKFLLEDDKLIYNNYTAPPAKGVKMYSELSFSQNDTALVLSGSWKTNRTKQYAAINGTILLQKKKDVKESLLIAKLDTLKLTRSLSFMVPGKQLNDLGKINDPVFSSTEDKKRTTEVVKTGPSNKVTSEKTAPTTKTVELPKINSASVVNKDSAKEKDQAAVSQLSVNKGLPAQTESLSPKQVGKDTVKETALQSNQQPGTNKENTEAVLHKDEKASAGKEKVNDIAITTVKKPVQKQDSPDIVLTKTSDTQQATQPTNKAENVNVVKKENGTSNNDTTKDLSLSKTAGKSKPDSSNLVAKTTTRKEVSGVILKKNKDDNASVQTALINRAAAAIASRKIEAIRSVDIKADSLVLTLYDNGEVDGDTVSVLLNGKVIMPMEGLSLKAITKTIYLTPEMGDSVVLIMYAENLGSIPPNTGLLVVHDGDDVYEIRFSGDLTKNSSIILKRKRKPGKQ